MHYIWNFLLIIDREVTFNEFFDDLKLLKFLTNDFTLNSFVFTVNFLVNFALVFRQSLSFEPPLLFSNVLYGDEEPYGTLDTEKT